MKIISTSVILLACVGSAWAGDKYTAKQLVARFYYDLGPAEVDVSGYPKKQQENYQVFAKTCSQCHTLARPINSPIAGRKDWNRFIHRMYLKTKVVRDAKITPEAASVILDFLAYDSQIRKVKNKAAFETQTKSLKAMFDDVRKERGRIQQEEDAKKVKQPAPYTGTK